MTRLLPYLLPAVPLAALAALAATGCNPYDPQLGDRPFRCGMSDPVCPDGYSCSASGVCIAGDDIRPDASTAFVCADDGSLEPNDMPNRAFVTPIPSAGSSYSLLGLALCPEGDVDNFQFGVTVNGTNLDASVVSVAGRTPLQFNLLTSTGSVIATGVSDTATPQMVKLQVENRLAAGTYILQVKSPDMSENNYDLSIKTCPNTMPLPCPP
ncbi:MAG TPA: hypothetical protein VHE35_30995 [Kofleriaceae bacterium]|nr:hypothetical protein [Kofleriaceae bacterium]